MSVNVARATFNQSIYSSSLFHSHAPPSAAAPLFPVSSVGIAEASQRGTLATNTNISYHSPAAVFEAARSLWHWDHSDEGDINCIVESVLVCLERLLRQGDGTSSKPLRSSLSLSGSFF
jgi:hypothetical protein